ncbi:MAG: tripartite tricarboxylate transporter permease [Lentisphaerae bacterium]|nr:tripartite tricarboxylate transporter permease [Lentisphaerota bacterium]
MPANEIIIACFVLIAGIVAAIMACVPGLHAYNTLALLVVGASALADMGTHLPGEILAATMTSVVVVYAIVSVVPTILISAPDESGALAVLPGQEYMIQGRGLHAVGLMLIGGAVAIAVLIAGSPFAFLILSPVQAAFKGHTHWVLWCTICFMLMSEWPREGRLGQGGWTKFLEAWRVLASGIGVFLLSGFLGFILLYRSPIAADMSFQNIMPAFVGMFAMPWLVLNTLSAGDMPSQSTQCERISGMDIGALFKGAAAGVMGGTFAAFFPVITGGIGGLMAGHATSLRDSRSFLVSQGAARVAYYAGGLLFFAVPGTQMTRGGAAWMLRTLYEPLSVRDYWIVVASIAGAGAVAITSAIPAAKIMLYLIARYGHRRISFVSLLIVIGIVFALTGMAGLAVAIVGMCIGFVPVLNGSRRMNCLGVILLPMACNMSGIGPAVAGTLGLLN